MPSASPGFTERSTPRRISTVPARLGRLRYTSLRDTAVVVIASNMVALTLLVEVRMLEHGNHGA
jgi:hypothetical protein